MDRSNIKRNILVIYCGGTIGMKKNAKGAYEPKPNAFIKKIRSFPDLHDKNSPQDDAHQFEINVDGVSIHYTIEEYDPLLDSSNMSVKEWILIANDIKEKYNKYDAFVVLHGTDTLAYTASALSYMLEGLRKTVVITGSQISIFERRSDAKENFLSSIIFAGCYDIGEVCVCFAHKLFRGNRTIKFSSNKLKAFDSPNYHSLGTAGITFDVFYEYVFNQGNNNSLDVFTNLNPNVSIITFHPTITSKQIKALLSHPTEGAVLQSYGIGNVSSRSDIMEALKEAVDRGIIIVNITQCIHGTVDSTYETGRVLSDIGVLPGHDMKLEAAFTKLCYVLGHETLSLDQKKEMMMLNLRGEMTIRNN